MGSYRGDLEGGTVSEKKAPQAMGRLDDEKEVRRLASAPDPAFVDALLRATNGAYHDGEGGR